MKTPGQFSMKLNILTSNRGFAEWGEVFGEPNTR